MLRTRLGPQSSSSRSSGLVTFSVGGRRLAARTQEVGGVSPWPTTMPVPSRTPFVTAIARRDKELLPVFDLAAKLNVTVQGEAPLCLIARHEDGPMAICIDAEVPSLRMVDASAIHQGRPDDPDADAIFQDGTEQVPIYSLSRLGKWSVEPRRV